MAAIHEAPRGATRRSTSTSSSTIRGHARAKYMHHMTANWCPIGRAERGAALLRRLGHGRQHGPLARGREPVGGAGWDGLRAQPRARDAAIPACRIRRSPPGGPRPRSTGAAASTASWCRRRGRARSTSSAASGVRGRLLRPRDRAGGARAARRSSSSACARSASTPTAPSASRCVGAFRTALRNDSECVLLWAIPRAEQWAAFERAQDADPALRALARRDPRPRHSTGVARCSSTHRSRRCAPGDSRRSRIGSRWRRSPS